MFKDRLFISIFIVLFLVHTFVYYYYCPNNRNQEVSLEFPQNALSVNFYEEKVVKKIITKNKRRKKVLKQKSKTAKTETFAPQVKTASNFSQSILQQISPEYPRVALRRGWQGSVTLKITVNTKGLVSKVEVLKNSDYEIFETVAIEAVKKWKFKPAASDEKNYFVVKTVTFKIVESDESS